jgi:hypothetical protein
MRKEAAARFQELFSDPAHQRLQEPLQKARECAKVGRFEMARDFYEKAVQLQPRNWARRTARPWQVSGAACCRHRVF